MEIKIQENILKKEIDTYLNNLKNSLIQIHIIKIEKIDKIKEILKKRIELRKKLLNDVSDKKLDKENERKKDLRQKILKKLIENRNKSLELALKFLDLTDDYEKLKKKKEDLRIINKKNNEEINLKEKKDPCEEKNKNIKNFSKNNKDILEKETNIEIIQNKSKEKIEEKSEKEKNKKKYKLLINKKYKENTKIIHYYKINLKTEQKRFNRFFSFYHIALLFFFVIIYSNLD